ncbi:hypothetical protein ACS0TY_006901 [Phlomoides rotata]
MVYDSLTIQIFETKWAEFLEKFGLQNNEWLRDLYNERQKWVPVYLHHTFWTRMISTHRSEGMHAYFDEFVHSRSTLKQFMEQYDIAIGNKIQKEFVADFQSKNKIITCITHFPWEKQFQKVYTNSIFGLVQDQIKRMYYCHVVPLSLEDVAEDLRDIQRGIDKIRVLERSILNDYYHKEFTYTVEWRYLLSRWRKDVYRRHSIIIFAGGYPHMTDEYKKFQEVEKHFQECTDLAMGSVEKMEFIKERCIQMRNDLLNWNPTTTSNADCSLRTSQRTEVDGTPILDPRVANPRGRPRQTRYMSTVEARG